jgi:hypothetical protein
MMKYVMTAAALTLLSACGDPPKPVATEKAKTITAGEYEVTSEVTKLASADKSTPATIYKMGDKNVIRACIAADGALDPAMFIEKGDSCTAQSSYVRAGRLSVQYQCSRPDRGNVYPAADGNFTADGFEALVTVGTAFAGDGDYNLTQHLTAKRVGECPPPAPAAG